MAWIGIVLHTGLSRSVKEGNNGMILFIYGAGGAGIEIYDMVKRNLSTGEKYDEVIFIDDFQEEGEHYGAKRIPFSSCGKYAGCRDAEFVIAVGEPSARKLLFDRVVSAGYSFATLVDETAIISPTAQIGIGCVIDAGTVVSSAAKIQENCLIMFHTIIGHHALVGRDCVICPQATVGGHSTVGEQSFLGLDSSMKEGVHIGKHVIVGLGSMVFRDVEEGMTVIGNPARATKGNSEHKVFH